MLVASKRKDKVETVDETIRLLALLAARVQFIGKNCV
jgi:hypothetical protein